MFLELPDHAVDTVLLALGERPHNQVRSLIDEIVRQANDKETQGILKSVTEQIVSKRKAAALVAATPPVAEEDFAAAPTEPDPYLQTR